MIKTTVRHHYGKVIHIKNEGFFACVTATTNNGETISRTALDPDSPQKAIDRAEWAIFRTVAPESHGTDRLMSAIFNN